MVVRKTKNGTHIKNALIAILYSGLRNDVAIIKIYNHTKRVLRMYGVRVKNRKDVDNLARKLLLTDSRIEGILKRDDFWKIRKRDDVSKLALSSIYTQIKRSYRLELEKSFGVKERLYVPVKDLYNEERVSKNKRLRGSSFRLVNKKTGHD